MSEKSTAKIFIKDAADKQKAKRMKELDPPVPKLYWNNHTGAMFECKLIAGPETIKGRMKAVITYEVMKWDKEKNTYEPRKKDGNVIIKTRRLDITKGSHVELRELSEEAGVQGESTRLKSIPRAPREKKPKRNETSTTDQDDQKTPRKGIIEQHKGQAGGLKDMLAEHVEIDNPFLLTE